MAQYRVKLAADPFQQATAPMPRNVAEAKSQAALAGKLGLVAGAAYMSARSGRPNVALSSGISGGLAALEGGSLQDVGREAAWGALTAGPVGGIFTGTGRLAGRAFQGVRSAVPAVQRIVDNYPRLSRFAAGLRNMVGGAAAVEPVDSAARRAVGVPGRP